MNILTQKSLISLIKEKAVKHDSTKTVIKGQRTNSGIYHLLVEFTTKSGMFTTDCGKQADVLFIGLCEEKSLKDITKLTVYSVCMGGFKYSVLVNKYAPNKESAIKKVISTYIAKGRITN